MSSIATVTDGKVVDNTAAAKSSSSSSLDKDAFLQLLVTQMKYQDPLQPQDNTEYVSQLATFSELEEMQNMSQSSDLQRATTLVGQYVTVKTTDSAGQTSLTGGKVDYVLVENNKAFLNIDGKNYSIDDLDSVVDEEYLTAYNLATDFNKSLNDLPTLPNFTMNYKDVVENLRTIYDDMSSYQQQFISAPQLTKLQEYEARIKELTAQEEG